MYQPPSYLEIRQALLDAYRNKISGADVSPGSEIYARASLAAAAEVLVLRGLQYVEDQIFVTTADSEALERHATDLGMDGRLAATQATGTATLTGTSGTTVSAGLTLVADDGTEFTVTVGGEIGGGELEVAIQAVEAGTAGNLYQGDTLTVQSPPSGVDSAATVGPGDTVGGTDQEDDEALRARVLLRKRAGNAGGTEADYQQWALAVDGVTEAHVLPLRRGLGTVSVAVYTEGPDGYRAAAGADLRADVLAALDAERPVTADVDVPAVTEVELAVHVHVTEIADGYDEDEVTATVEEALTAWIYSLETGETARRAQIYKVVIGVAGVLDCDLLAPDENESAAADSATLEIFVPGTLTVNPPSWTPPL